MAISEIPISSEIASVASFPRNDIAAQSLGESELWIYNDNKQRGRDIFDPASECLIGGSLFQLIGPV